jgi:hypothetical protein
MGKDIELKAAPGVFSFPTQGEGGVNKEETNEPAGTAEPCS